MKKYLAIFLIVTVALSQNIVVFAKTYEDAIESTWYSSAVNIVSEEDIMIGDKKGFHPNGYLTRAQAAQIIVNLNHQYKTDIEPDNNAEVVSNLYKTNHRFSFNKDLHKHWAADSVNLVIAKMAKNGYSFDSYQKSPISFPMVTGYGKSGKVIDFNPEKAITRAEFAAMIIFGFLEDQILDGKTNQDAVNRMISLGILQGYPKGKGYKENNLINRAEAAVICVRSRDIAI